jgi:C1A family cysteine protease
MREAVFAFNSATVDELNNSSRASGREDAATFKNNFTSDMTQSEFEAQFTGALPVMGDQIEEEEDSDAHLRELQTLPTAINWFTKGRVSAVKNQGACGSCWAFGAGTVLESAIAIKKNVSPVRLSEQELVDCSGTVASTAGVIGGPYGNAGCNGGWMSNAWNYIKYNGISTNAAYPYKAVLQTCAQKGKTKVGFVSGWNNHSASTIKAASAAGVVSIAVNASPDAFRFYSTGVVQAAAC